MSIKYAVLGLIAEGSKHGYAIRAEFEERIGDFWELNYGQVYQVLTALEKEHLIIGRDGRVGKRPQRKVYSISEKGHTALDAWLQRPPSRRRPFRDDFYVRLLFADHSNLASLQAMLSAQIAACQEHLAELVDRDEANVGTTSESAVRRLFTKAAIMHAEADLKALEVCRVTLGTARLPQTQPTKDQFERPRRAKRRAANG